jgi:CBS domain containing-hemolysin-like protein
MTRVRQFSESEFQGSRGLERAWEMTERLEIYLSGCQLGITICSVGLGVVAEPALAGLLTGVAGAIGFGGLLGGGGGSHAAAAILALGIINILHVVVGEQAPTYLGIERTKTIARFGAPILYWWTRILSPVIRFADWVAKALLSLFGVDITRSWAEDELEGGEEGERPSSRGELLTQMGSILSDVNLSEERRREVLNAVAIDRILVGDIMVDRDEVVVLSTDESIEANFETIRESPHSRFPVVRGDVDDVAGVIYVPALLRDEEQLESGEQNLEDVAVSPMTVPPDLPVSDLIDRFQEEHQELAIVEEGGRTEGLVTSTDAFEVIAGELEDPLDDEAREQEEPGAVHQERLR